MLSRILPIFTLFLFNIFLSFPAVAEDRALIIGINTYEGDNALEGCRTDAENMERVVEEVWGYKSSQIKTLFDKKATRKAILDAFDDWLIRDTRSGDRVFFYFSGHGMQIPDEDGDEEDGIDEAFCPVEMKDMITDDEINNRLKKLSGRQVIFVADSCHSGTTTRALNTNKSKLKAKRVLYSGKLRASKTRGVGLPEPRYNTVAPTFKNVIAYSAVSPTQLALDGGPNGGVFTNAFIKAVKEKAADTNHDGKVTHGEVLSYVQKESQKFCDETNQCTQNDGYLTPQLDANAQWNSVEITAHDAEPPSPSSSVDDVMTIAEGCNNENGAQLQANILPSTAFNLGDKMQFTIKSQRTGYLFLLDINSKGQLTVLFPNKYSKRNNRDSILEAGQTVTIPDDGYDDFKLEALEPTGEGLLLALLLEENEETVESVGKKLFDLPVERGFGVVEKPSKVNETLGKLSQKLHQTILGPEGVGRPIKWSIVTVEYEINR